MVMVMVMVEWCEEEEVKTCTGKNQSEGKKRKYLQSSGQTAVPSVVLGHSGLTIFNETLFTFTQRSSMSDIMQFKRTS